MSIPVTMTPMSDVSETAILVSLVNNFTKSVNMRTISVESLLKVEPKEESIL